MDAVRYRTGIDRSTGAFLVGWDHVRQSLETIWTTRPDQRVMLLDFGTDLRGFLGEDITPDLALAIYDMLVRSVRAYEPEYRLTELQFVRLAREGALGLRHVGVYYPEGRLGNYALALPTRTVTRRWRWTR
jgi:phage baseplate assembly protein W